MTRDRCRAVISSDVDERGRDAWRFFFTRRRTAVLLKQGRRTSGDAKGDGMTDAANSPPRRRRALTEMRSFAGANVGDGV